MNILITIIKFRPNRDKPDYAYEIPVGLAYISAVLKKSGHSVSCLNLNHGSGSVENMIRKALMAKDYELILTGGLSVHYSVIKACMAAFRQYAPNTPVILGGGIISSRPELIFKALKPDYAVIGEGEYTILELVSRLANGDDLNTVRGIMYWNQGQHVLTPAREAIADINVLPYPDYEGLGFEDYLEHMKPSNSYYYDLFDYPRAYPLISSRSCPFQCTFCFHPTGNIYRQRSIDNIMDELTYAIPRYNINLINIYDELFSINKTRVLEFCKRIKRLIENISWEIKWNCQMRVDTLDEEMVRVMKDSGCYLVSLGLESYSRSVLESMRKNITPEQIDKALEITRRFDITVQGNFIFGDTAETMSTAQETLSYWKKSIYGGGINLNFIQAYPGTSLYNRCLKKGLIKDEIEFIVKRIFKLINMTDGMTDKELQQLKTDIYEAKMKYLHYVEPIKGNPSVCAEEIHVQCPFCCNVSIFKNYTLSNKKTKSICCRSCRKRFHIISPAFKNDLILCRVFGSKNIYHTKEMTRRIRRKVKSLF
jgi:anaerobic magnesium-protoporphyrin IX monomethyl ester cyclase